MKKFLLAAFLLMDSTQAWGQASQGALLTNPQTGGPLSTGWWLKIYAGGDYSFLGDVINSLRTLQNGFQGSPSLNPTVSTSNLGFVDGTEAGFSMDPDNSLSFEAQDVGTQNESFSFTNGGTTTTERIGPSMQDYSLNYYRTLYRGGGTKTYVMVGGGYYHTALDYYNGSSPSNSLSATFTGDIIGGTLGVGELMSLGNNFILGFSVKGRLASFSQVNTHSLLENGTTVNTNGPYPLLLYKNFIGVSSMFPPGSSPSYAVVDYSGIDGELSIAYHF